MTPLRLYLASLFLAALAAGELSAETFAEMKADFSSADKQLWGGGQDTRTSALRMMTSCEPFL